MTSHKFGLSWPPPTLSLSYAVSLILCKLLLQMPKLRQIQLNQGHLMLTLTTPTKQPRKESRWGGKNSSCNNSSNSSSILKKMFKTCHLLLSQLPHLPPWRRCREKRFQSFFKEPSPRQQQQLKLQMLSFQKMGPLTELKKTQDVSVFLIERSYFYLKPAMKQIHVTKNQLEYDQTCNDYITGNGSF